MAEINIHEAKTHLSRLVQRAIAGEEIVISRAGKPIARLVPIEAPPAPRELGRHQGEIWIADDFDAPLPPDILATLEGGE
jgi:prevent-host-death family protein